ncbi:MAG: glycosyltransferase family 2 protein [Candidatus Absconditicoccaceae bacterium]
MYNNQKVSVIFPAYNEEKNIFNAIADFLATGYVDELIVVDNNSKDNTYQEAKRAGAIVIKENNQGYGRANRRGLKEATGDIIITVEPDGTFVAKDIIKLLIYSDEFDAVFGTRTSKEHIWSGAKMNRLLRMGNVLVAKLLEYCFNGTCLSDVGCTFKLIKKKALHKIIDKFTVGESHFSPEYMILVLKNHIKCVEIPVNYKERIGDSKITSDNRKAFKLGLIMVNLILKYRFGLK